MSWLSHPEIEFSFLFEHHKLSELGFCLAGFVLYFTLPLRRKILKLLIWELDFTLTSSIFMFRRSAYLSSMAVTFHGLSSAAGLKKLDEHLLTRSYITGLAILILISQCIEVWYFFVITNWYMALFSDTKRQRMILLFYLQSLLPHQRGM